nr:MAG TPA: hypothetical protein [Caudoviricetes sp.]
MHRRAIQAAKGRTWSVMQKIGYKSYIVYK